MIFAPHLRTLLAVAFTVGGAALFSIPAQAGGFYDEGFEDGPRIERRVTTTLVERRVARPVVEEVYDAPAPVYARPFVHRRPVFARPVLARPVFAEPVVYAPAPVRPRPVLVGGYGESCRVIVKRIENEWGDVVVKKTRICG